MTIWTRCCLSVLVLGVWGHASAAEMDPAAKKHFDAGQRAFEVKKYADAVDEFFLGYMLDPQADFLYAIGQVYRQAGDCPRAREAYTAFIKKKPGEKKVNKARANIERCVNAPPKPPDQPKPVAQCDPAPAPVEPKVDPPPKDKQPEVVERKKPRRVSSSSGPGPWYTDWLGDSLAVTGFVALGVGGFLWAGGSSDLSDANEPGKFADYAAYSRAVERASQKQTIGIVTFAAGGALMTAAVIRWVLRDGPERPRQELTAAPTNDGGMVFFTSSF